MDEYAANSSTRNLDILVIGAGQAGLVTGRLLSQTDLSFRLQEAHAHIGDSWRQRFDSLVLFSSRAMSALPGLAFVGDPGGYPSKNEVADYLACYTRTFNLPVTTGDGVISLERRNGLFFATTDKGALLTAKAVIVATGAFQKPVVPPFAQNIAPEVLQLTAKTYRNPAQLPHGRVIVVGAGASGRQIARELSATHETWLSSGSPIPLSPQRVLGRDIMWWFAKLGVLTADKDHLVGRLVRRLDATPGLHLALWALRRKGVHTVGRLVDANDRKLVFAKGITADAFESVIWAMGYRDDDSWIKIPGAIDDQGQSIEARGVATIPGLFYVGRNWQNSRASALLYGVGDDAVKIVDMAKKHVVASVEDR